MANVGGMKRLLLAATAALLLSLSVVAPTLANPGPGNSNQCAPGQQGNADPGFKPGVCR